MQCAYGWKNAILTDRYVCRLLARRAKCPIGTAHINPRRQINCQCARINGLHMCMSIYRPLPVPWLSIRALTLPTHLPSHSFPHPLTLIRTERVCSNKRIWLTKAKRLSSWCDLSCFNAIAWVEVDGGGDAEHWDETWVTSMDPIRIRVTRSLNWGWWLDVRLSVAIKHTCIHTYPPKLSISQGLCPRMHSCHYYTRDPEAT